MMYSSHKSHNISGSIYTSQNAGFDWVRLPPLTWNVPLSSVCIKPTEKLLAFFIPLQLLPCAISYSLGGKIVCVTHMAAARACLWARPAWDPFSWEESELEGIPWISLAIRAVHGHLLSEPYSICDRNNPGARVQKERWSMTHFSMQKSLKILVMPLNFLQQCGLRF